MELRPGVGLGVRENLLCNDSEADKMIVNPTLQHVEDVSCRKLIISIELEPTIVSLDLWVLVE